MKVEKNKLIDKDVEVPFILSPHHKSGFTPRYVILHNTEGPTAAGAITTLTLPKSTNKASAHFVVDLDGKITQLVSLDQIANHAGRSYWAGLSGLSRYSFGIEIVNEGRLAKTTDSAGNDVWRGPSTRIYSGDDVLVAAHKYDNKVYGWKTYPSVQLDKILELAEFLVNEFGLSDVLGHDEVSPKRKWDPGPAFPIENLRKRIFARPYPLESNELKGAEKNVTNI